MADFPLNSITEQQLESFRSRPGQGLLIAGPHGSGTLAIAKSLVSDILQLERRLDAYPYVAVIQPEATKAISIDEVRKLEHFLCLKVPRKADYNRAVIIADSHLMTKEAQNALLKTLEEPPAKTLIVLTATSPKALLPTVQSRLPVITVKPAARKLVLEHFAAQGHDAKRINQAYAMSGGLPELMQSILSDEIHPLEQATEYARKIAGGQAYDRLLLVDQLAKQKQLAIDTTFILQQMARISLQQASGPLSQRWQNILKAAYEANEALQTNAQAKLVLTNMMLAL